MRCVRWRVVALCLAAGLAGCDDGRPVLAVDLRTDLIPVVEFARVRTTVMDPAGGPSRLVDREVDERDDLIAGRRVAELPVDPGQVRLLVELVKSNGMIVAMRPVVVTVTGSTGVTVVITRDCRGVVCPGPGDDPAATACLAERCVEPECTVATPELCPPPQCSSAGECPPGPACTEPQCEGGACLVAARDARCAPDELCDPELGCVPRPEPVDAGAPVDAGTGMDGGPGPDAGPGRDAGGDAGSGTDAGPFDAGIFDSGVPPFDAAFDGGGGGDAGGGDAGACADIDLGSMLGMDIYRGTTRMAGDDYSHCFSIFAPDLAFRWRAPAADRYTFDLCGSPYDTVLTLLDGCGGSVLACNDDRCSTASSITYTLAAGQEVILVVDGLGESGLFELSITLAPR
jgi:hypothetical protein